MGRASFLTHVALGIVSAAFAGWIDPTLGGTWFAVFLGLCAANVAGFIEGL